MDYEPTARLRYVKRQAFEEVQEIGRHLGSNCYEMVKKSVPAGHEIALQQYWLNPARGTIGQQQGEWRDIPLESESV